MLVWILAALVGQGVPGGDIETHEQILARVQEFHGGCGPWAVVGYRMGSRALRELGTRRHDHDLLVIHRSPAQVQYTCMADGLMAATGASAGKLNLKLESVPIEALETVILNRETGQGVRFRVRPELAARIKDLPYEELEASGRHVVTLKDEDLFIIVHNAKPE